MTGRRGRRNGTITATNPIRQALAAVGPMKSGLK
jgi:hypothetical protein